MNASLKGKRGVAVPAAWPELYEKLKKSPNEEVRQQAQALAATFGGSAALDEMRKTLADAAANPDARKAALDSLLAVKDAPTLPLLLDFVKPPGPLRASALRGLAGFDDARIPAQILAVYPSLEAAEKHDAIGTLLARAASARALLAAIDAKALPRADITAPLARQLQSLHDAEIDAWLAKNWGAVRTSSADKQKQIAKFKEFLTADSIQRADARHGRALFAQTCALCHTIFGEGAKIGPELPGGFEDLDYLLQNIVDPNAIIGKDYQQTFIETKDGQMLSGIIAADDATSVTLKTLAGPAAVQRADIKALEVSPNSLMPEGLLSALDEDSVRDLFLYLRQRQQVPLPAPP
jgi:putative heme-binding domain-containing protein